MVIWPLVRVMSPVTAKSMVSPELAVAIACRNEPAPLSPVLVTVMVLLEGAAGLDPGPCRPPPAGRPG